MMNYAFQKKPFNPHLHYHVRPRYEHPVEIEGVRFFDPEFGYHYNRARDFKLSLPDTMNAIRERIKEELRILRVIE